MAFDDFPQKLYVTLNDQDEDAPVLAAHESLEAAVHGLTSEIEVAEYVFNKHFKARNKVEIVDGEEDSE